MRYLERSQPLTLLILYSFVLAPWSSDVHLYFIYFVFLFTFSIFLVSLPEAHPFVCMCVLDLAKGKNSAPSAIQQSFKFFMRPMNSFMIHFYFTMFLSYDFCIYRNFSGGSRIFIPYDQWRSYNLNFNKLTGALN